jgi:phage terminase large subunit-like protein
LNKSTTIIKRKWLTTYDSVSHQPGDRIIMSWDIALSETESGDYSAGVPANHFVGRFLATCCTLSPAA